MRGMPNASRLLETIGYESEIFCVDECFEHHVDLSTIDTDFNELESDFAHAARNQMQRAYPEADGNSVRLPALGRNETAEPARTVTRI
jgi:hypothetical protein